MVDAEDESSVASGGKKKKMSHARSKRSTKVIADSAATATAKAGVARSSTVSSIPSPATAMKARSSTARNVGLPVLKKMRSSMASPASVATAATATPPVGAASPTEKGCVVQEGPRKSVAADGKKKQAKSGAAAAPDGGGGGGRNDSGVSSSSVLVAEGKRRTVGGPSPPDGGSRKSVPSAVGGASPVEERRSTAGGTSPVEGRTTTGGGGASPVEGKRRTITGGGGAPPVEGKRRTTTAEDDGSVVSNNTAGGRPGRSAAAVAAAFEKKAQEAKKKLTLAKLLACLTWPACCCASCTHDQVAVARQERFKTTFRRIVVAGKFRFNIIRAALWRREAEDIFDKHVDDEKRLRGSDDDDQDDDGRGRPRRRPSKRASYFSSGPDGQKKFSIYAITMAYLKSSREERKEQRRAVKRQKEEPPENDDHDNVEEGKKEEEEDDDMSTVLSEAQLRLHPTVDRAAGASVMVELTREARVQQGYCEVSTVEAEYDASLHGWRFLRPGRSMARFEFQIVPSLELELRVRDFKSPLASEATCAVQITLNGSDLIGRHEPIGRHGGSDDECLVLRVDPGLLEAEKDLLNCLEVLCTRDSAPWSYVLKSVSLGPPKVVRVEPTTEDCARLVAENLQQQQPVLTTLTTATKEARGEAEAGEIRDKRDRKALQEARGEAEAGEIRATRDRKALQEAYHTGHKLLQAEQRRKSKLANNNNNPK